MSTHSAIEKSESGKSNRTWLVICCIALVALALSIGYFSYGNTGEGESVISSWLPWIIVALCPLMHFFMHKGHGHHSKDQDK